MDSLFPAPRSASASFNVPYLDTFQHTYIAGEYSSLRGIHRTVYSYSEPEVDHESIKALPAKDLASCLQAWLFFGLISEFFSKDISTSEFVKNTNHGPSPIVIVEPVFMTALLNVWATHLATLNREDRAGKVSVATELLDFAAGQIEWFDKLPCNQEDLDTEDDSHVLAVIVLSVKLLISYLRSTIQLYHRVGMKTSSQTWLSNFLHLGQQVSARTIEQISSSIQSSIGGNDHARSLRVIPPGGKETLSSRLLLGRFEENGWCAVRAKQLCRVYDYSVVNYLSKIRRTDASHISHLSCAVQGNGVCVAYDLTSEMTRQYQPKHIAPGCNCQHIYMIIKNIGDIIKCGSIPILSMDPAAENLDIRVHKNDGMIAYTAISHVWSDGRGNPQRNSLPLCQLRKLASVLTQMKKDRRMRTPHVERYYTSLELRLSKRSSRRIFFWMDTLCIPIDLDNNLQEVKAAAIRHITPIFQGAEAVLVLDSELESLKLGGLSEDQLIQNDEQISRDQEELTARIIGSKWIQRAWTLEEGALARDCHFLVAGDRTLSLGPLVPPQLLTKANRKREKEYRRERIKSQKKNRKKTDTQTKTNAADLEMAVAVASNTKTDAQTGKFDIPFKLLLAGPLNENRKQAARDGTGRKEMKLFMQSRSAQFVDVWNDLLERSATKPDDPILIFANILDFNTASIQRIGCVENRLPMIVNSCQELPLSLLFNTGRKTYRSGQSRDGWIPVRIEGDRLMNGAIMRRANDGFQLDTTPCKPGSLQILCSQAIIPIHKSTICIEYIDNSKNELFIIEISTVWREDPEEMESENDQTAYKEGKLSTCIIIDRNTGSESVNGFTGRGAILSVLSRQTSTSKNTLYLSYRAPIRAWTYEQWLCRCRPSGDLQEATTWISISNEKKLLLDVGEL